MSHNNLKDTENKYSYGLSLPFSFQLNIRSTLSIKISIITVSKNSSHFIEETILSVLNQTYGNIEFILIDGASQDGTIDIIKQYAHKITYWISEPDRGMYDAINKGLAIASGDYILILNSDDLLANNIVIEQAVKRIEVERLDWYYGNLIKIKEGKTTNVKVFNVNYKEFLFATHGTFVPHPCFFISSNLNSKLKGYQTKYKFASDYDYILRALKTENAKGKHLDVFITKFRIHEDSITAKGLIEKDRIQILSDHNYYQEPKIKRLYYYYKLWMYYKLINWI